MSWQHALSEIESHEFDANLNVVSSMRAFFSAASKEPAVVELYGHVLESGDISEEVLGRIFDLARLAVDPRYENPKDTPLAILLWLTYFAAPDYAQMAASYVDHAPQCWYAKKLARRILMPPPMASGDSWVGERQHSLDPSSSSSGDSMIVITPRIQGTRPDYLKRGTIVAYTVGNVIV